MLTKMTKARRISGKMKAQWSKELDESGFLICSIPGCSQRYVTLANFSTHYKWCSGEKDLKLCPYCSSLIFSENKATLHHMEVEHPDKVEEYKANFMLMDEPFEAGAGTSNAVTSIEGEGESSEMYVEEVSSRKLVKKPKEKRFYSKENHLSPKRKFFKHKMKHINAKVSENIKEFKKCVRFDSIVSKINSVSEVAKTAEILQEASDIKSPKKERKPRYILTGNIGEEQNFFEDDGQTDSATDVAELPDSKLKLNTKSKLVLDLDRYKRYNEYLKWTRDWGSERKTYSRSKPSDKSLNSTFSTPLQSDVMEIQDIHQLDKSLESSRVSLASELGGPSSKISLNLSESDLETTNELTASASDVSIFETKTMGNIDTDLIPVNAHTSVSKDIMSLETAPHEELVKEKAIPCYSRANMLINEPVKVERLSLKLPKIKTPIITYGKQVVPDKVPVNSKSVSDFDSLIKNFVGGKRPYKKRKYNPSSSNESPPIPPQQSVDEMAKCNRNDGIKQPGNLSNASIVTLPKRRRGRPSKIELEQRENLLKLMFEAEQRNDSKNCKETESCEMEDGKPITKMGFKKKLAKFRNLCRFKLSGNSKFKNVMFKGTQRLSKFKGLNRIVYNARKISHQNMLKRRRSAFFGNRESKAPAVTVSVEQDVHSSEASAEVKNLLDGETIPKNDHNYSAFGAENNTSVELVHVKDTQNAVVPSPIGNENLNTVSVMVHKEMESPCSDQPAGVPEINVSESNVLMETTVLSHMDNTAGFNSSQDPLILTSTPISQSKLLCFTSASTREDENCNDQLQQFNDNTEKVSPKGSIEDTFPSNVSPNKSVTGVVEGSVRESYKFNKKLIYHPENINSVDPVQHVGKAIVEPSITFDELKRSCQDQNMSVSDNFMSVDSIGAITEVITQGGNALESHRSQAQRGPLSEKIKRPRGRPKKLVSKEASSLVLSNESVNKASFTSPRPRGRPKKQVQSEKSISEIPNGTVHIDAQAGVQNTENSKSDLSVNTTSSSLPRSRGRPKRHITNEVDTSGNLSKPVDESSAHVLQLDKSESNISTGDSPMLPRPRGRLKMHMADEKTISESSEPESVDPRAVLDGEHAKFDANVSNNSPAVHETKTSVLEKLEQSDRDTSVIEVSNEPDSSTKSTDVLNVDKSKSDVNISSATSSIPEAKEPIPEEANCSTSGNSAQIDEASIALDIEKSESNAKVSTDSPALPKSRGRPKKYKRSVKASSDVNLNNCSPALPRSRGRPKKHVERDSFDSSYKQTSGNVSSDVLSSEKKSRLKANRVSRTSTKSHSPVAVRKSNRFKLKKVITDYSVFEKIENDFKVIETAPQAAPPPKTGRRGRPRKYPLKDSDAISKNDSSKMVVSRDLVNLSDNVDTAESVLKKCSRKGRPQKCIDYANINSGNLDVEMDTVSEKSNKASKRSEVVSCSEQEPPQLNKMSSSHDDTFILPPKKRKRVSDSKIYKLNDGHVPKNVSESCSTNVEILLIDETLEQSSLNKLAETIEETRRPIMLSELTKASQASSTAYIELFPEYESKKNMYILLTGSEYENYLPPLKKSICFKIEKVSDAQETNWTALNPFESLPIGETNHFTFFAGGPVSSSAFCPTFGIDTQYIALSMSDSLFDSHYYDHTSAEKGLIQIWNLGNLSGTRLQCQPSMELGISHNYGKVFEMAWCPYGAWQDPTKGEDSLPRLGLLAVAFSDSCIRIYSIPHPRYLEKSSEKIPLYSSSPCVTLTPLSGGPGFVTRKSPCTCLSWQKTNGCERMAGGYGNGMICVWLVSSSATIFATNDEQKTYTPYLVFQGHGTPVTSVSFSPLNRGRWLVSSSFDRTLKFFDLLDTSVPFCTLKKGFAKNAHWANNFCGAFGSLHEDVMFKGSSFFKECGVEDLASLNISDPHSLLCISALSEVMNAYAVADVTGAVSVNILKNLYQDHAKHPCYSPHDIFQTEVVTFEEPPILVSPSDADNSCAEEMAADIPEADVTDVLSELINSLEGDISNKAISSNSSQLLQFLDTLKSQNPKLEASVLKLVKTICDSTKKSTDSAQKEKEGCMDQVMTIMDKHFTLNRELLSKIAYDEIPEKEVTDSKELETNYLPSGELNLNEKEPDNLPSSESIVNKEEADSLSISESDVNNKKADLVPTSESDVNAKEADFFLPRSETDVNEKGTDFIPNSDSNANEKKADSLVSSDSNVNEKEADSLPNSESNLNEKDADSIPCSESDVNAKEADFLLNSESEVINAKETEFVTNSESNPNEKEADFHPSSDSNVNVNEKEADSLPNSESNLNEKDADSLPCSESDVNNAKEADFLPSSESEVINPKGTEFVTNGESNEYEKEADSLPSSDSNVNEKEADSLPNSESNLNEKDADSLSCSESDVNAREADLLPSSESEVVNAKETEFVTNGESNENEKKADSLPSSDSNVNEKEADSLPNNESNFNEKDVDSLLSSESNLNAKEADSLPCSESDVNTKEGDFLPSCESEDVNEKGTEFVTNSESNANEKEADSLPSSDSNVNEKEADSLPNSESNLKEKDADSLPRSESDVNAKEADFLPSIESDVNKQEISETNSGKDISNTTLEQRNENPLDSNVRDGQVRINTEITACCESSESGKHDEEDNAIDSSSLENVKDTAGDSLESATADETQIKLLPCDSTSENATMQSSEETLQSTISSSQAEVLKDEDLDDNVLPIISLSEEETSKPTDVESVGSEILEYECDGESDVPDDFDQSNFSEDSMLSECSLESDCSVEFSLPSSPMPVNECNEEDQSMDMTQDSESPQKEEISEISHEIMSMNVCGTAEDSVNVPTISSSIKDCSISSEELPAMEALEPEILCETVMPMNACSPVRDVGSPACSSSMTIDRNDSSNVTQSMDSTLAITTNSTLNEKQRTGIDSQISFDTKNKEKPLSQTSSISSLPSTSVSSTPCDTDDMEVSLDPNVVTPSKGENAELSEAGNSSLQQGVASEVSNDSIASIPDSSENAQDVGSGSGNTENIDSASDLVETLHKFPIRKQSTKRAFLQSLKYSREINLFNSSKDRTDQKDASDVQTGIKKSCNNDQYEALVAKHGLIYKDMFLSDIHSRQGSSNETKASDLHVDSYGISSVNTIAWNPNHDSRFWLFTAGNAGIGRLSCLSDITVQGHSCRRRKM